VVTAPKRARAQAEKVAFGLSAIYAAPRQVLAQELDDLKRRRVQMRADNRALAQQEKNLKKRRAARQLSDDDLLVLLRQPPGDPAL
ncbi:unnamed protein product, partial [Symbiodinium pilosum]